MYVIFIFVLLTDEEFQRLKLRDPEVFEKIYIHYHQSIYDFLMIKTKGNEELVNDLFGNVIKSALISVPKLKNADNIQGWLIQIAFRRFNDYLRSLYKQKRITNTLKQDFLYNSAQQDIIEDISKKEKLLLIKIVLEKLPPHYQKIMKMRYNENESIDNICKALNKTKRAVYIIINKAKKIMKTEIKKLSRNEYP